MIGALFHTVIYAPLYNGLVFLVDIVPGHDMGLAVIALTIVVRVIIYPLSKRAVETQMAMKKIAPEVEELKKKYKKNSTEQNAAVLALYKERGVHPFAGIGLILVQLPVLLALYWVFARGGFPAVDSSTLYSFVHAPGSINMEFLGLINMAAAHSIPLVVIVVVTQFIYTRLSMGSRTAPNANIEASLSNDMARSFDLQARYVFPLIFGVVSYTVPAAAPLYWATSNVFMILQELWTGRRF